MTPDAQARHARESLRLALGRGWSEVDAKHYAAEALRGQGVPIAEARSVVAKVWRDRFEIWGAV